MVRRGNPLGPGYTLQLRNEPKPSDLQELFTRAADADRIEPSTRSAQARSRRNHRVDVSLDNRQVMYIEQAAAPRDVNPPELATLYRSCVVSGGYSLERFSLCAWRCGIFVREENPGIDRLVRFIQLSQERWMKLDIRGSRKFVISRYAGIACGNRGNSIAQQEQSKC
jgi:hypothetical protein